MRVLNRELIVFEQVRDAGGDPIQVGFVRTSARRVEATTWGEDWSDFDSISEKIDAGETDTSFSLGILTKLLTRILAEKEGSQTVSGRGIVSWTRVRQQVEYTHWCGAVYRFRPRDLERLLERLPNMAVSNW